MKIEKVLNISAETFFEKITNSVIYDIFQSTGEKLNPEDLEGKSYFKLYTKSTGSTITITHYLKNKIYAYEAVTNRNQFHARYEVEEISEKSCRVIYEEQMVSADFIQKLNDSILGIVIGPLKKRRFKNMLLEMEK